MSDTLRDKVIYHYELNRGAYTDLLDAAIALVLEEAARVAEDCSVTLNGTYEAIHIAAAIRALKEDSNADKA